jgi:hypothetical protein
VAVVGHDQPSLIAGERERDPDVTCAGVLDDVAQQLSRCVEQESVERRPEPFGPVVEVDVDDEAGSRGGVGEVPQGARQTAVAEHRGVELGDGRAQHPRRFAEGVIDAIHRLGGVSSGHVLEVESRRQHVLQRPVVQALGEAATLTLFQVHEPVEQVGAVLEQPSDRGQPGPLDS